MPSLARSRVVVFGAHGFLGRHVLGKLVPNCKEFFAPTSREVDLRDLESLKIYLRETLPDVVIHLAAQCGGIQDNRSRPVQMVADNAQMALNIVKACDGRAAKLVALGSVCAYACHAKQPMHEDDLFGGMPELTNNAYGQAKRLLLTLCKAYHDQEGMRCCYLLPANLYGPADSSDPLRSHVIPGMIRKFMDAKCGDPGAHKDVRLMGTGRPTRDFLYVEDAAEAIVLAADTIDEPVPINLGTGRETSIEQLAKLIQERVGHHGKIIWDPTFPDGQPRRCLDTTRAEQMLKWKATTRLEEGLGKTIEWFKKTFNGESHDQRRLEPIQADCHIGAT